jgi:type IV pilus assembly protein PilB
VPRPRIGELLLEAGILSAEQLEQALERQKAVGDKIGEVLVELRLVTEAQLTQALSRQLSVPWVSLHHVDFSRQLLNMVPREIAERHGVVPIFVRHVRRQGDTLYVAMDDPTNDAVLDALTDATRMPVRPMIACPSDIRHAIRVYYDDGEERPEKAAPPKPPPPLPERARRASSDAIDVSERAAGSSTAAGSLTSDAEAAARAAPSATRPEDAQVDADATSVAPDSDESPHRASEPASPSGDSPDAAPELEASEYVIPQRRSRPKMVAVTLLDGTTINLPAKRPSRPDLHESVDEEPPPSSRRVPDQLTARDLVAALRAVAEGVDASAVLGRAPKWEPIVAALLSLLLRKGVVADWEFVEELKKLK